jgi:hypothetical protein
MSKKSTCIVHIGLHKTGTTSIQHFLRENRNRLQGLGFYFYHGIHIDQNHVELHAATMRPDRTSTFRMKSGLVFDDSYLKATCKRVNAFLNQIENGTAVFSAEGLSLLRYVDEVEKLASIMPADIKIVAYLRNPEDYLRSHANQLSEVGITGITDKTSHAYMASDTWMIDYEQRLEAYRTTFGQDNVIVVDYDDACARDSNVIPSFLRLLNLEKEFSEKDWQCIRRNQS